MFDFLFTNPYSVSGLKIRIKKLPMSPYKVYLSLVVAQLEAKKIDEKTAKKAIEYFRTNKPVLIKVAIKMLELSDDQSNEAWINIRGLL